MSAQNNCVLLGRLVRDAELLTSQAGRQICKFTIAVTRSFKSQNGQYEADFINCVMYGKRAEVIPKFFHKGSRIHVVGEWKTGSYENKEGQKVYTNDLVVGDFSFVDSRESESANTAAPETTASPAMAGFESAGAPEELPFS